MKKGVWVSILVLVLLGVAVYFTFFYLPKCNNVSCWEAKLSECRRAKYVNNAVDVTWEYRILGNSKKGCKVEVEALQVVRGLKKTREIEGKEMVCYLPYGENGKTILMAPEADPNLCNGLLKEELQSLMIENLYRYIIDNLGEIDEELLEV